MVSLSSRSRLCRSKNASLSSAIKIMRRQSRSIRYDGTFFRLICCFSLPLLQKKIFNFYEIQLWFCFTPPSMRKSAVVTQIRSQRDNFLLISFHSHLMLVSQRRLNAKKCEKIKVTHLRKFFKSRQTLWLKNVII